MIKIISLLPISYIYQELSGLNISRIFINKNIYSFLLLISNNKILLKISSPNLILKNTIIILF